MNDTKANHTIFVSAVRTQYGKACARLLIESLRTFGGAVQHCPFWLFEVDPENTPCRDLESLGVKAIPLEVPEPMRSHLFGNKVYAGAQAELLAPAETRTLVWIDPSCLVIQPPLLYDLGLQCDAAFRPVHIRNVGSLADQPMDTFWQKIYEVLGVKDDLMRVESFVDGQRLRAYFNSHAFAVNPKKGLLKRWLACFEILANDQEFQSGACRDEDHQVFLFQATLSTLIASSLDTQRIRILPPDYNYPLNLQESIPLDRRAAVLNNLTTIACEDHTLNPNKVHDIEIREPLRAWLLEREKTLPENLLP